ncbi:MAG: GAF domain-containing protein, partial [Elusimicrobia bacterium]|nr:GAF domain-containing protein [Elusimicrobiota bacterium]
MPTATHPEPPSAGNHSWAGPAAFMGAVCLGMAALTAGLLRHHYADGLRYWRDRQIAIIADRSRLAENWLSERRDDARDLAASPALRAAAGGGPAARAAALVRLERIRSDHGYAAVCLSWPGGALSAPAAAARLCPPQGAGGEPIAVRPGLTIRLAGESPARSLLGFAVPLSGRGPPAQATFWTSPVKTLFADLVTDAVPTRTGETILVYRDAARNEAVYLSPLRGRSASEPRLRRSLAGSNSQAQAALEGRRTFIVLPDYRGVPVFASTSRMPSTGWGMVRKIDRAEALEDFHRMAAASVLAALVMAGLFCGLIWAFWRRRQQAWLAERRSGLLRELADSSRISRLNRVYTVLSSANHAIVHARARQELIAESCRVTAERGGFPLVWVGFTDPATGRVQPEARAGAAAPHFARHWISTLDVAEGRGLSGRAIRENRPVVLRDILADPDMRPWHELASAAQLRSGAAFPLTVGGRPVGVLSIAAAEVGFFDEMEVKLLAELAMDLSYALEKLEQEERRREAEQALGAERDRLETVTRHAGVGLAVFSREHRTVWANQVMHEIFGDARGRTCNEIFGLGAGADDNCIIKEAFAPGAQRVERQLTGRDAEGRRIWSQVIASPMRDAAGEISAVMLTVVPTTERKVLEEQLRQAQKIEAVGRLAGGMAHDFNNFLTAIRGYAELLTEDLPAGDRRRKDAREILLAADRASALTRQLLALSRRQVLTPQVIDINEAVADISEILRRLVGAPVELVLRLEPALGLVRVDPGQLQQVIVNLALNARDAMPKGGTLTISTRNTPPAADAGPAVALELSDTGEGMDEKILSHIFDPFFTTKPKGKGTGLGLSTAFGIVKQSGGDISVQSQPGRGSAFRIQFPRCEQAKSPKPPPEPAAVPRGSETVLLAEDEAPVRALVERLLRRQGYTVLSAGGGAAALEAARRYRGPVHLLVSDVVMPGLTGPQLAERLLAQRPQLRVLYISAHADESALSRETLG